MWRPVPHDELGNFPDAGVDDGSKFVNLAEVDHFAVFVLGNQL